MAYVFPTHGGEDVSAAKIAKDRAATFGYQINGATGDIDALLAIDTVKPATVAVGSATLVFDSIKLKHIEADVYSADVSYIHPEEQKNEEDQNNDAPQISFDSAGNTQHITHSLKTMRSYPEADKDRHKQAIGVEKTAKGEVKIHGTDVVVPALKVLVSAKINQPSNPFAFGRTMARCTGRVNKEVWNDFGPWELLFRGGKLTGKRREKWTLDYDFEASEDILVGDNFMIGDLGPIYKEGHAHLWVEWKQVILEAHSDGKDVTGVKPVAVFIEQIYREFNMGDLGL